MINDSDYIVVYGTLMRGNDNKYSKLLSENADFISEVSFPGKLYDLGEYPGAIYDPDSSDYISADLFRITKNKQNILNLMDEYEGIIEYDMAENEYERKIIRVSDGRKTIFAWAYLLNLNPDQYEIIESGNYAVFNEKKQPY